MKIDFSPEGPPPVPGRIPLAEYVHARDALTLEAFLASQPGAFLLQMNDPGGVSPHTATGGHSTLAPGTLLADDAPPLARFVFEVVKRPGANAQADLVTIGRAETNDVIVSAAQVSKFHASIARGPHGSYLLADHSSMGTWIGSERLEPDERARLVSGETISLGQAVRLKFLDASGMYDYLQQARFRLARGRG